MPFFLTILIAGSIRKLEMTKCAFILFPECRFVVENFVIDRHVRYILTVYPVVIVALVGNVYKHYDPEAPGRNAKFTGEPLQVWSKLYNSYV